MFENDFFNVGQSAMTEQLPISIYASDELVDCIAKIQSVINRLEAQFNFQTMTANWYEHEDEIVSITLYLRNPEDFTERKLAEVQTAEGEGESDKRIYKAYSDDVFSTYNEPQRQLYCTIAITTAELSLLIEQEKLLMPYLQKKLHKVLNLIAEQLQLPSILAS